ncbi:lipase member H-A-like [Athalia rosae]|uniref:lipase member H-A-like n=1 Tax=Athalia rosae TaxID=37344 RepID=UPI0020342EA6|nr:lipase member H-A-like [Athalia rosae]
MIGRLLDQLILSGVSLTSIHIIGFSLGAHVAGFAGKNVKLGVVRRITGLDPALPMFIAKDSAKRLHQTDAVYVDIIHTCAGTLGIKSHIGHADFYPNGGSEQSGCYDGERDRSAYRYKNDFEKSATKRNARQRKSKFLV